MHTVRIIAGIETDHHTLSGLGLVTAAIDEIPDAVKIGPLYSVEDIHFTIEFLKNYSGYVVLDFSLLLLGVEGLFSHVDVLVIDLNDAEIALHHKLNSQASIEAAAAELLMLGAKSIIIKGAHLYDTLWEHDYWTNGHHSFWLTQLGPPHIKYFETGTVFSTAIVASLALGYSLQDALVIAKMYVHQALRLAQNTLYYGSFPEDEMDLPYLSSRPLNSAPQTFKYCHHLGLYPVVDSFSWVETLLLYGVKTIQLRIKERTNTLEDEIKRSIDLAKKYKATLFINDYWDLALKYDAEAIHLGQADLDTADLDAIQRKGLLLGVSTYCYYEVARAHAISPSYVAIGPIYPTSSKEIEFKAQGIERLQRWQRTLHYPLVAIGGITVERMPEVVATGVSGVALISAITEAEDPQKAIKQLLNLI